MDQTLSIIKPDATRRNITGSINKIIEENGWDKFSLAELAKVEKISLLKLKKVFSSKNSILIHF